MCKDYVQSNEINILSESTYVQRKNQHDEISAENRIFLFKSTPNHTQDTLLKHCTHRIHRIHTHIFHTVNVYGNVCAIKSDASYYMSPDPKRNFTKFTFHFIFSYFFSVVFFFSLLSLFLSNHVTTRKKKLGKFVVKAILCGLVPLLSTIYKYIEIYTTKTEKRVLCFFLLFVWILHHYRVTVYQTSASISLGIFLLSSTMNVLKCNSYVY